MRFSVALLSALVVGVSAAAQPPDQPPPVFRSTVELVAVDVSVLDANGQPVRDLSLDDFTLRVDGRSRHLVSAQFVPLGAAARPRTSGVVATHYSTNARAVGGRLIIFVVDQGNIRRGQGRPLMTAASRFIDGLEPTDRIALAAIPNAGPYADFTVNHRSVQRQIQTLLGAATPPLSAHNIGLSEALAIAHQDLRTKDRVVGRECQTANLMTPPQLRTGASSRTADTARAMIVACEMEVAADARLLYGDARQRTSASLLAMRNLLDRLALVGGPKTLVLLSEGLFADVRETGEFRQVAEAAAAANATIYALGLDEQQTDASMDSISPTFNDDRVLRLEGLELLVGLTRGRVFPVVTGAERAFDRISREISGYYLLGFEPEADDRDGGLHQIDVDVRRPGVEVRSRRTFLVDRGASSRPSSDVLAEILRTPLPATDLTLETATFTLPGEGRQLRLVIATQIEGATAAGSLPCGFSLTDARGNVVGAEIEGPMAAAKPVGDKYEYLASFAVDPGDYTLKIAAVDDLGRRGSVEHRFTAALAPAGQLRVGDLMLAETPAGRGGDVRPSIDTRMTRDAVIGYLEFTSEVPSLLERAQVSLEVAPTDDAAAIEQASARIEAPTVGRRVAEGRLPTDLLPPGEYTARAVVSVGGQTFARVTRPFRLERPLSPTPAPSRPSSPRAVGGTVTPSLRGPAGIAGVETFERQRVLSPDVVGYFLNRLPVAAASTTASGPVATALEAARHGEFDAVDAALTGVGDSDLTAVFLRGLSALAHGDLEHAAQTFRRTVGLSHEFFAAAFYLGACYAAGGRDEEAAAAWQTSLVTEGEARFVWELLGDALLRLEEGQQAVDILSEAGTVWPDDDGIVRRLAVAQAVARQHSEAIATLERHLASHPDDANGWALAAWLVYDARLSDRPLGTTDEDLARIRRYREHYAALKGPDVGLLEQWERAVEKKK